MKRKEDPRLVQGMAALCGRFHLAGMLFAAFLRSPHAHAKIRLVDFSRARTAPGVLRAVAATDLMGAIGPVPCAAQIPDMKAAFRPVLATTASASWRGRGDGCGRRSAMRRAMRWT